MAGRKVAIWLTEEIEAEITSRGNNRSGTIQRDLSRLYTLYRRALQKLDFTESEAMLITEALNGTVHDANTAAMLWARVDDAIKLQNLDQTYGVDRETLMQKLKSLGDLEAMAVVDAVERYWNLQGEPGERLHKVGLVRGQVEKKGK